MNDINANSSSDHILVGKVLGGDTKAFSIIILQTERLVTQIVFKMIANTEDRRDIAQDVYLKAFQKLSGFRFQSKLSTWIGQIAYNTCLNHLEKRRLLLSDKQFTENDADKGLENGDQNISHIETDTPLIKKELSMILQTELENLSPIYRTLLTLYHTEEMSYSEIAQITELPDGTVKNYLFRARRALKEALLKKFKKEDL